MGKDKKKKKEKRERERKSKDRRRGDGCVFAGVRFWGSRCLIALACRLGTRRRGRLVQVVVAGEAHEVVVITRLCTSSTGPLLTSDREEGFGPAPGTRTSPVK